MRSRVLAVTAAAGLAAGALAIGFSPAQAQPTVLLELDHVIGTGQVAPPISNAVQDTVIKIKGAKNYTAPTSSDVGLDALVGGAVKAAGKFVTDPDTKSATFSGGFSCSPTPLPGTYPPSGKLTITYANFDPSTLKQFKNQAYVALGESTNFPGALDVSAVRGIGIKSVGLGADVSGDFIQQPSTAIPVTPDLSTLDTTPGAGAVVPGTNSLSVGLGCTLGTAQIDNVVFGTDGTSIVAGPIDGSVAFSLPG